MMFMKKHSHMMMYAKELDKETLAKIAELKKTDPKAAAELSRERSYLVNTPISTRLGRSHVKILLLHGLPARESMKNQ